MENRGRGGGAGGMAELLKAHSLLCNMRFSYITSMALKCAIELGIPDVIAAASGRPIALPDLAAALSVPPSKSGCLRRLMRLLVQSGVFATATSREDVDAAYTAYLPTTLSDLLVKGAPLGLSRFAQLGMYPGTIEPFNHLGRWLRLEEEKTPPTAFEMAHGGKTHWEFAGEDPIFNELFNDAMAEDSRFLVEAVIEQSPEVFEGVGSLVDVGGGYGSTARAIAAAFPAMRCTVLDLPHVIAGATATDERVRFVAGDMFQHVPPANAVLLKWILHDWSDEDCVRILRRCKEAVGGDGKLIIIDMLLDGGGSAADPKEVETRLFWDMRMMVGFGGAEREEKEWKAIFAAAGLTSYRILPAALGFRSLIEINL